MAEISSEIMATMSSLVCAIFEGYMQSGWQLMAGWHLWPAWRQSWQLAGLAKAYQLWQYPHLISLQPQLVSAVSQPAHGWPVHGLVSIAMARLFQSRRSYFG